MATATASDPVRARLILDDAIASDRWLPPAQTPADGEARILTLAQWQAAGGPAVQVAVDDDCAPLWPALAGLELVAIHFDSFTDGRGFSLARRLREAGFGGELRARGQLLPDQAHYLRRCGFNALEFADPRRLATALEQLQAFSDGYQAAFDQPQPLFRRRA